MMKLNLKNMHVLTGCSLLSQRPRNGYETVRSIHQCAQIPPLSTRLSARLIWDKTKNKDFMKTAGFLYENCQFS